MSGTIRAAVLILSALSLASLLASASPLLATVTLFAPAIGGAAVLLALVPALRRRRRGDWMVAGIALAVTIASLHPFSAPAADRPAVLRVVELNSWLDNRDPAGTARWILAQDADAVVLLEARAGSAAVLAALAPAYPHRVACRRRGPCSTVILARAPFLASTGLARGDADNRRALSAATATLATAAGPLTLVAVHLSHPLPAAAQLREADALVAALAGSPRERLVVTGDFNLPGWSSALGSIAARLGLARPGLEAPTWPAPAAGQWFPALLPIDHALAGSAWRATVTRGPALGSDHYPLIVAISPASADARS